jgi:glucosyl-3-phosphoglycerate phosphatase
VRQLVLVRHGESVWNAEGRIQGQRCAGLSPEGHEQAVEVAGALARRYPAATVTTSDLQRAAETAAPIAAELGVPARPDERLRERHFGAWEGRLRDEVRAEEPDRWARWWRDDVIAEVGGESTVALTTRALQVLQELLGSTPDGAATIAVSHGGTIWHGTHALLDLPTPSLGGVANASIAVITAGDEGGGWTVLDRWNEIAHLDVEVRPSAAQRAVADAPPVGR